MPSLSWPLTNWEIGCSGVRCVVVPTDVPKIPRVCLKHLSRLFLSFPASFLSICNRGGPRSSRGGGSARRLAGPLTALAAIVGFSSHASLQQGPGTIHKLNDPLRKGRESPPDVRAGRGREAQESNKSGCLQFQKWEGEGNGKRRERGGGERNPGKRKSASTRTALPAARDNIFGTKRKVYL